MRYIYAVIIAAVLAVMPRLGWALDVCTLPIQTAPVAISTATTTQIVGVQTIGTNPRRIVVCGYDLTAAGTAPTYQFDQGTGTNCGSGGAVMSGAEAPTAGTHAAYGGAGATIMATNPGQELCIITTGTPSIQGLINYVVVP